MARKTPNQATIKRWDRKGYPHKGWICLNVMEDEERDGVCEMCGEPGLRWLHELEHDDQKLNVNVGRVCAGHLQENYDNPKDLERLAKNKSNRKKTFLAFPWKRYTDPKTGASFISDTKKAEIRITHDSRGWLISDFHRKSDLKHFKHKHDKVTLEDAMSDLFEIYDELDTF